MSSFLSNTGFQIITGSWQVENQGDPEKRKKQITCKVAGVVSLPVAIPYGYFKADIYKSGDTSNFRLIFGATLPNTFDTTGQNGYMLTFDSSEAIALSSIASGTGTVRLASANAYASLATWYSVLVKRYPSGVFYVYIKGGSQFPTWTLVSTTGGTGTNPVTNATYTTSQFINLQLGTGDAIRNIECSSDFSALKINNQI